MTISQYDSEWKKLFEEEKKKLQEALLDVVVIEHVGSTAIVNQKAKPIVDIFVACTGLQARESYENLLGHRYIFVETGMKQRFLFNKKSAPHEYNVHIMAYDENFFTRHEILFRDYMNAHPELLDEHNAVKESLMEKYGPGFDYTFGKTAFVQKIVDLARTEKGLELIKVWE